MRSEFSQTSKEHGASGMSPRPVERVGAGAEFGVLGEQADVVREGVQALTEDPLGGVVVVVVVLGQVGAGERKEEPGVGPVGVQRGPRGGSRLGRPAATSASTCSRTSSRTRSLLSFKSPHPWYSGPDERGRERHYRLYRNPGQPEISLSDLCFCRATGCNRTCGPGRRRSARLKALDGLLVSH
ncbi:hypothetical protein ACGFYE_33630 [Streptomyces zaomyceticus]|uniref:hypothetical protein n=1 Tax=Streptomyces zaomyceticus TaxID=68286 RepID=UPI003721C3C0